VTGSGAGDSDDLDDDELEQGESHDGKLVPVKTTFELADTLYAEAELEETDTVYLWLGVRFFHGRFSSVFFWIKFPLAQANVMLSYKIPAAIELLRSKHEAANISLDNAIEDLEFIREQMTVMEVNTARVYNWDVKRRRERRDKERLSGEGTIEA
jgi:hypothetical protein